MVAGAAMAELGFGFSTGSEERLVPPPSPEVTWARAAARGDRTAFGRLVDLHKRTVFGLCVRLLRDPEESQDAAQETFVRAYGAISTYDPGQPFAPWILRIARNHSLDLLRRRPSQGTHVELDRPATDESPALELADDRVPAADAQLEGAERRGVLEAAVAGLPENYREVIQLFHVEHLSYKEIASTLDVPIGTVMTWLHRARGKLRVALEAQGLETKP